MNFEILLKFIFYAKNEKHKAKFHRFCDSKFKILVREKYRKKGKSKFGKSIQKDNKLRTKEKAKQNFKNK